MSATYVFTEEEFKGTSIVVIENKGGAEAAGAPWPGSTKGSDEICAGGAEGFETGGSNPFARNDAISELAAP